MSKENTAAPDVVYPVKMPCPTAYPDRETAIAAMEDAATRKDAEGQKPNFTTSSTQTSEISVLSQKHRLQRAVMEIEAVLDAIGDASVNPSTVEGYYLPKNHPDHPFTAKKNREISDVGCDWPAGGSFSFHDEPGEHDPCYVVMPGGGMIELNHHASEGVDIARAKFIVQACNRTLFGNAPTPVSVSLESGAKACYNAYFGDNNKWPDATDNERALYLDGTKATAKAWGLEYAD